MSDGTGEIEPEIDSQFDESADSEAILEDRKFRTQFAKGCIWGLCLSHLCFFDLNQLFFAAPLLVLCVGLALTWRRNRHRFGLGMALGAALFLNCMGLCLARFS